MASNPVEGGDGIVFEWLLEHTHVRRSLSKAKRAARQTARLNTWVVIGSEKAESGLTRSSPVCQRSLIEKPPNITLSLLGL
jgi:hypothetical protein